MNEVAFVQRREQDWKRFTHLCDRAEASPSNLKPLEFHEFIRLYRRISGDLALARTRSSNVQLIDFLNDMVGRAYGILYRSPRKSFIKGVIDSVAVIAQTVRRRRWMVFASASIVLLGILSAYFLMDAVPQTRSFYIPPQMSNVFDAWKQPTFDPRTADQSGGMALMYATNNPLVAIKSGAESAASFGVLTLKDLYQNGSMLGALLHEVRPYGQMPRVLIWISPHGVPEFTGLILSGASGFTMAWALINPGRRKRGDALREAGKDAIIILGASVLMMFIAAPIEGFFSFSPNVPNWAKIVFAMVSAVAWGCFWTFFGRTDAEKGLVPDPS